MSRLKKKKPYSYSAVVDVHLNQLIVFLPLSFLYRFFPPFIVKERPPLRPWSGYLLDSPSRSPFFPSMRIDYMHRGREFVELWSHRELGLLDVLLQVFQYYKPPLYANHHHHQPLVKSPPPPPGLRNINIRKRFFLLLFFFFVVRWYSLDTHTQ